ncbi:helix-turn-helix domain-containing protein [Escherichia coli]|uniref:helix-turn-helix domain-containing protein n=1 Tax=Escherichia coli TaxID=562 RepID=UPI00388F3140
MHNRHTIDRLIVQHIILWIEDNIESTIKIEDVATITGYCRRNVQLIFKRYVHISLGEYIRRRKIARAAALLKTSTLNLIDISIRLHFDSQQSFTREFKKYLEFRHRNTETEIIGICLTYAPHTSGGKQYHLHFSNFLRWC